MLDKRAEEFETSRVIQRTKSLSDLVRVRRLVKGITLSYMAWYICMIRSHNLPTPLQLIIIEGSHYMFRIFWLEGILNDYKVTQQKILTDFIQQFLVFRETWIFDYYHGVVKRSQVVSHRHLEFLQFLATSQICRISRIHSRSNPFRLRCCQLHHVFFIPPVPFLDRICRRKWSRFSRLVSERHGLSSAFCVITNGCHNMRRGDSGHKDNK
mmetsp:Transcript_27416/g.65196  ORF Transcript_27416/g.65196 Transcript_27416/m.65196 type:complete len:211 (+) Transcript_27416:638-1270(+)